jgi:K+-sensing histidine kinase KdpD
MRAVSETAAGWPLAASLALVLVRDRVRAGRRRRALNQALHELRRPLQALSLMAAGNGGPAGQTQLDLARLAVADLDATLNDEPRRPRPRQVPCRPLVEAAIERWRRVVADPIGLRWEAGSAVLVAEPERLSQALDNLIANALEHGRPPVLVAVSRFGDRVRIAVKDGGEHPSGSAVPDGPVARTVATVATRLRAPGRRRHGLRVVSSVAAGHGGRFAIHRSAAGTIAILELPLAGHGAARAA